MDTKKLQRINITGTKDGKLGALPYIPDGTYIILYQNNRAGIGKYCEPTGDEEDVHFGIAPYLQFPQNVLDFEFDALELVKTLNPEDLDSENDIVYVCPDNFIEKFENKMIWY